MTRQATARFTDGLSGWLRSALPGVVIDAPDEERGRRDHLVDAAVYLGAFAIGAATLAGTWEMHSPWLRVVDVVVGIATLVSLHWRRTHPAAVGIGIGAVSLVILTASGANLAATFNAAIRARGRDLAIIAGLLIAWAFASPLLYPPTGSYWANAGACVLLTGVVLGWGLFVRARRELVRSLRAQGDRAAEEARAAADRPRDARRARPPPLAALRPRRRTRVSPRRPSRGGRRSGRRDPRKREDGARGAARRDRRPARGRRREPDATAPADARRPRCPRRGVARGRNARHRPDRAGRRGAARRRRAHRVPDRAGGPDERAQARAGSRGDAHRPRARRRPGGRGPQPCAGGRRRGRAAARGGNRLDRARRARLARQRHARARRRFR